MWIKRFRSADMAGALAAVRAEFGSEALILGTRRVRRPGLLGWLGHRHVEVTAASEASREGGAASRFAEEVRRVFSPAPSTENAWPEEPEVDAPRETPSGLAARARLHQLLTSNGVGAVLARQLVNDAARACAGGTGSTQQIDDSLRGEVTTRLRRILGFPQPLPEEPAQRVVALFVGPTGVGKTTTVAKIAARHALQLGWSVEVVTTDTYRVAAQEQLAQYAGLIGVPFYTAKSPGEAGAYARRSKADLVLVDSAGRSHLDEQRMGELEELAAAIEPTHVFLCLTLAGRDRDALDAVARYRHVGFNRLLFTKLDETRQPGLCLNVAHKVRVPLSYLTTGQRVPEDLVTVKTAELAGRLLEVSQ